MSEGFRRFDAPYWLFLIIAVALLTACQQSSDPKKNRKDRAVVRIGSDVITDLDFENALQKKAKNAYADEDPDGFLDKVIKGLVDGEILYLLALEVGYGQDSMEMEHLSMISKQWIGYRMKRVWDPKEPLTVSDEELEAILPASFERIRVRQITLPTRVEAEDIKGRLLEGEDFLSLARKMSIDPVGRKGGAIQEYWPRGRSPLHSAQVHEELFSYQPGEFTDPLKTTLGWTVFQIEKREPIEQGLIDGLKGNVRNDILIQKKVARENKVLESYPLEVDRKTLERAMEPPLVEETGNLVIARVGAYEITLEEFEAFIQWKSAEPEGISQWEAAIQEMSSALAFYQEAKKRGLAEQDSMIIDVIERYRKERIRKLYMAYLEEKAMVTDESEIWEAYLGLVAGQTDAEGAGWYRLRQMRASSAESADDALFDLKKGIPWDQVYGRYSVDPGLPAGGALKSVPLTDMSWSQYSFLSRAPVGIPAQYLSHPDGTATLYFIESRVPGRASPLEEMKDEIVLWMQEEREKALYEQAFAEGKEKYSLVILDRENLMEKVNQSLAKTAEKRKKKMGGHSSSSPKSGSPHRIPGH